MYCLNLCEFLKPNNFSENEFNFLQQVAENEMRFPVNRVYIGSSFCSQYFLHFCKNRNIYDYCKTRGLKITLTVPIFTQKDLSDGKRAILFLCNQYKSIIDEVTCNDIGMLNWLCNNVGQKINLGQLFCKNTRDFRFPIPAQVSFIMARTSLYERNLLNFIEISPYHKKMDDLVLLTQDLQFALHQPYCYITTSNICKFASINVKLEQKFRPNICCSLQCKSVYEYITSEDYYYKEILKYGRTVYYKNLLTNISFKKFNRIIYWPIESVLF